MVLLLLGAAVALYAAVLLSEFDKERRGGSEDTPAPPPPPLAPGSDAPSYVDHVVADEPWCAKPPARTREPPPRPAPPRPFKHKPNADSASRRRTVNKFAAPLRVHPSHPASQVPLRPRRRWRVRRPLRRRRHVRRRVRRRRMQRALLKRLLVDDGARAPRANRSGDCRLRRPDRVPTRAQRHHRRRVTRVATDPQEPRRGQVVRDRTVGAAGDVGVGGDDIEANRASQTTAAGLEARTRR